MSTASTAAPSGVATTRMSMRIVFSSAFTPVTMLALIPSPFVVMSKMSLHVPPGASGVMGPSGCAIWLPKRPVVHETRPAERRGSASVSRV